jgi:hypothetical protein
MPSVLAAQPPMTEKNLTMDSNTCWIQSLLSTA